MGDQVEDLTEAIERLQGGDPHALSQLYRSLYSTLRRRARRLMASEPVEHTLEPTALVHEAFVRLAGAGREISWEGRTHFYRVATRAMRRVLLDRGRRARSPKHGGGRERLPIDGELTIPLADGQVYTEGEFTRLDAAIRSLERKYPRSGQVVNLRYFTGLTIQQVAEVLGVSVGTVKNDWSFAMAWLRRDMQRGQEQ